VSNSCIVPYRIPSCLGPYDPELIRSSFLLQLLVPCSQSQGSVLLGCSYLNSAHRDRNKQIICFNQYSLVNWWRTSAHVDTCLFNWTSDFMFYKMKLAGKPLLRFWKINTMRLQLSQLARSAEHLHPGRLRKSQQLTLLVASSWLMAELHAWNRGVCLFASLFPLLSITTTMASSTELFDHCRRASFGHGTTINIFNGGNQCNSTGTGTQLPVVGCHDGFGWRCRNFIRYMR
jgi:hypothetical protein